MIDALEELFDPFTMLAGCFWLFLGVMIGGMIHNTTGQPQAVSVLIALAAAPVVLAVILFVMAILGQIVRYAAVMIGLEWPDE